MPSASILFAAALCLFTGGAWAQAITAERGYLVSTGPMARAAAAFMEIHNSGLVDDRLIATRSDAAKLVQLHTHIAMADGVVQMQAVEGLDVPAGGAAVLARGGDHLMLMGLTRALTKGDTVTLILSFAGAGDITVEIPVNPDR